MTRLNKDLKDRMERWPLLASWSREIEPQGERPTAESDLKIWEGKESKNRILRARIEGHLLALLQIGILLDNHADDDPGEFAIVKAFYCKED